MKTLNEFTRDEWGLSEWSVLLAYRGSKAHGMYEPNTDPDSFDDIDLISICIPSRSYYFGLNEYGSRGTKEVMDDPWDAVVYESRKALSLLEKGNPNILSLLWLDRDMYLKKSAAGELLINERDIFSTKAAYQPFKGYAVSQMSKMTKGAFRGYMGAKRKELVKKHGYDTKHAAHLIRLLRMGTEFLDTGACQVDRSEIDARELLDIKHGKWEYGVVIELAEELIQELDEAAECSQLPPRPDRGRVNLLANTMVEATLAERDHR